MRISDWSTDVCSSDLRRFVLDRPVERVERQLLVGIEWRQIVEIDAVAADVGIVEIDADKLGERELAFAVAWRADFALDHIDGAQALFADLVRRNIDRSEELREGTAHVSSFKYRWSPA